MNAQQRREAKLSFAVVAAILVCVAFLCCTQEGCAASPAQLGGAATYEARGLACVAEAGTYAQDRACQAAVKAQMFGDAGEPK